MSEAPAYQGLYLAARKYVKKVSSQENFVLIVLLIVIMAVLGVLSKGITLRRGNLANILMQSSTRGIAAIGELFVILTGGIDLSVGSVAVMSACVGAWAMSSAAGYGGLPFIAGLSIMLLIGVGLGAINGLSVSRLHLPPFIATFAMWVSVQGAAYLVTGGYTIWKLPPAMAVIGQGSVMGMPMPAVFLIVAAIIAHFVLGHTTFGRSVYAVGGNESAAWLSGIKPRNIRFLVYTIAGLCAGVAAMILVSRVMSASVAVISGLELDAIAACVIGGVSLFGGRGTLLGAMIGALIIGVLGNGMNILGVSPALQGITRGAIIFVAVAVDMWRAR